MSLVLLAVCCLSRPLLLAPWGLHFDLSGFPLDSCWVLFGSLRAFATSHHTATSHHIHLIATSLCRRIHLIATRLFKGRIGIIRRRCAMHMWCPDGIGRESWDRVGQESVGWLASHPPQKGGRSPRRVFLLAKIKQTDLEIR